MYKIYICILKIKKQFCVISKTKNKLYVRKYRENTQKMIYKKKLKIDISRSLKSEKCIFFLIITQIKTKWFRGIF